MVSNKSLREGVQKPNRPMRRVKVGEKKMAFGKCHICMLRFRILEVRREIRFLRMTSSLTATPFSDRLRCLQNINGDYRKILFGRRKLKNISGVNSFGKMINPSEIITEVNRY